MAQDTSIPASPPRSGKVNAKINWTTHMLSILFLVVWEAVAYNMPPYLLPSPIETVMAGWKLVSTSSFYWHAGLSLWHVAGSIVLAFVVGLALALLAHFFPISAVAIHQRFNLFLSSFSTIGWTFLAIIWFGLTELTVVFAVAITLLPFAVSNLRTSLQELDKEIIEMAMSFGPSRLRNVRFVILPMMVPYIFATLRICLGVAWKVVLTAELFGGTTGLGYLVSRARANVEIPRVFAIIVVIIVFVYVMDKYVLDVIQRRLRRNYA